MATCGYLCPQCEGKGFTDDGTVCDWCAVTANQTPKPEFSAELSDEEWIEQVHGKCSCSDIGELEEKKERSTP